MGRGCLEWAGEAQGAQGQGRSSYLQAQVRDDGREPVQPQEGHHQLLEAILHLIVLEEGGEVAQLPAEGRPRDNHLCSLLQHPPCTSPDSVEPDILA